jgi:hypothetical protein
MKLAISAMTTVPPDPASPGFICLLSGPLEEFVLFSCQEHSQWLINIAHDICDPSQKRGSLKKQNAAGEEWIDIGPTDPLTASTYRYDVQAVTSLSKISLSTRAGRSVASTSGNAPTMADRVKQREEG